MSHAHVTITRIDEPQRLYAATFYCDRMSHMVPSGFADSPLQATQKLIRVLKERKTEEWAQRVQEVADQVESYFQRHPDGEDVEFTLRPC